MIIGICGGASGQVLHQPGRLRPQLTIGDTLTMSATPTAVTINLVKGGTAVSSAIAMTLTSTGASLLGSLDTYGYFLSATSALSGGSPVINIPTSCVLGTVATGVPTTATSFTQSNPLGPAGAGLHLVALPGTLLTVGTSSRTDNLVITVNLTTLPQLPAGSYVGTLFLQAQAF